MKKQTKKHEPGFTIIRTKEIIKNKELDAYDKALLSYLLSINVPVRQKIIAEQAGMSIAGAKRRLSKFKKAEVIKLNEKKIYEVNLHKLIEYKKQKGIYKIPKRYLLDTLKGFIRYQDNSEKGFIRYLDSLQSNQLEELLQVSFEVYNTILLNYSKKTTDLAQAGNNKMNTEQIQTKSTAVEAGQDESISESAFIAYNKETEEINSIKIDNLPQQPKAIDLSEQDIHNELEEDEIDIKVPSPVNDTIVSGKVNIDEVIYNVKWKPNANTSQVYPLLKEFIDENDPSKDQCFEFLSNMGYAYQYEERSAVKNEIPKPFLQSYYCNDENE